MILIVGLGDSSIFISGWDFCVLTFLQVLLHFFPFAHYFPKHVCTSGL